MKLVKTLLRIFTGLVLTAAIIAAVGILRSQKLTVTEYTKCFDGVDADVKIVFLSDIHGRKFGAANCELTELIQAQEPDIIAVIGDIINYDAADEEIDSLCAFLESLAEIAPAYFTIGNHEAEYMAVRGDYLLDRVGSTGAKVLECEYEDVTVNGTTFRLGGMSELAYYGGDGKYDPKAEPFLTEYCDTELTKVMLSHRPEAFAFKYACQDWDPDLVLSGHTHGGIVRLPLVGGLVAPIQGIFPDYCYGEYRLYDTEMIITSGLAGYGWVPRIYNPPEICVVTLTAKGQ